MKNGFLVLLMLLSMMGMNPVRAQEKPGNVCYISNDRIYFQLDRRWSAELKKNVSEQFSLDSALIEQSFTATDSLIYDSVEWRINHLNQFITEISKSFANNTPQHFSSDVLLLDDEQMESSRTAMQIPPAPQLLFPPGVFSSQVFDENRKFGLNAFKNPLAFSYTSDTAGFFLSGYQSVRQVYLSGTFNNWSTMRLPMKKTHEGWEAKIALKPGKYQYKYIVDGRWMPDPDNNQRELDGQGGQNSVVYCYNHIFRLTGFEKARKVYVAGSFNNWRPKKLLMQRATGGWELPIYLREGTHAYKFIVDRKWINDPGNLVIRQDANGNLNSFLGIGDTMNFRLKGYQNAKVVVLAGSFNGWSPTELLMNKVNSGWELPYSLAPGNHEYKFIVDGNWITDPDNPRNVGTGDFENSVLTFKPNFTFTLNMFPDAKEVIVTGSFNGWREDAYRMTKKDGIWVCQVSLNPGKYTYKFIVDKQWMIDPANDAWENNSVGTGNSVLWIEP